MVDVFLNVTEINPIISLNEFDVEINETSIEVSLTETTSIIQGGSAAGLIDDVIPSLSKTYSSQKIEDTFDDEIGDEDLNFTLLFQNQLSQGA